MQYMYMYIKNAECNQHEKVRCPNVFESGLDAHHSSSHSLAYVQIADALFAVLGLHTISF